MGASGVRVQLAGAFAVLCTHTACLDVHNAAARALTGCGFTGDLCRTAKCGERPPSAPPCKQDEPVSAPTAHTPDAFLLTHVSPLV